MKKPYHTKVEDKSLILFWDSKIKFGSLKKMCIFALSKTNEFNENNNKYSRYYHEGDD